MSVKTVDPGTLRQWLEQGSAGGIDAWASSGTPLSTGGFVLGLALVVASVLALIVSPLFGWITGVLGLGLNIAGATGFCGLARVMAYAPWNK